MNNVEVKDYYNQLIMNTENYESKRWFNGKIQKKAYLMTKDAINRFLCGLNYSDCFELGPGHGTWTRKLLKKNPNAYYTLVDISGEMLKLSQERFRACRNIEFICSDFLDLKINQQFDIFFSVRAIEYIDDKEQMVKIIKSLLKDNGRAFIITKTPKYFRSKMLGRRVPDQHKNQISPQALFALLNQQGFKEIKMHPVTVSIPVFNSAFVNWLAYRIARKFPLNIISQFISESYCAEFRK